MSDLPPELLEIVFTCLPLSTLLGTCTLVCSTWRDIIANPKFIRRRKLYYKTKLQGVLEDEDEDEPSEYAAEDWKTDQIKSKMKSGDSIAIVALLWYSHDEYIKKQHYFSEIVQ